MEIFLAFNRLEMEDEPCLGQRVQEVQSLYVQPPIMLSLKPQTLEQEYLLLWENTDTGKHLLPKFNFLHDTSGIRMMLLASFLL